MAKTEWIRLKRHWIGIGKIIKTNYLVVIKQVCREGKRRWRYNLNRLTGVEYLSDEYDEESFVMDDLGNRTGNQVLRDTVVNFAVEAPNIANRYASVGGAEEK